VPVQKILSTANRERKKRKGYMAYSFKNSKGRTYFLHERLTTLKNGGQQTIYFFASEVKAGAIDKVPAGYKVVESRNGLPVLKKA
jgi:hypothetical protein